MSLFPDSGTACGMAVLPPIQLQLQVKVGGWMGVVSLASLRVRETGWGVIKRG